MDSDHSARAPGAASTMDRLKAYALAPLPQHLLSRAVLWLTRRRSPLVTPVIKRFAQAFDVHMSDAIEPDLTRYDTFNAFFTRALKPAARPITDAPGGIACPADGRVSALGRISDARVLQAKGCDYSLSDLLGGEAETVERLRHGSFVTVYLSPRDYHRLHMPLEGTLHRQTHVPGRLWSVGQHAVRAIEGLFTRNERVIAQFDTEAGRMALVLVGAINVAAIETVWHGLVTPPAGASLSHREYTAEQRIALQRGEEMGRFNMGSTIIALFEQPIDFDPALISESPVRMGQLLGRVTAPA